VKSGEAGRAESHVAPARSAPSLPYLRS